MWVDRNQLTKSELSTMNVEKLSTLSTQASGVFMHWGSLLREVFHTSRRCFRVIHNDVDNFSTQAGSVFELSTFSVDNLSTISTFVHIHGHISMTWCESTHEFRELSTFSVDNLSTISTYLCKLTDRESNFASYPHFLWKSYPHYPHKQTAFASYPHFLWKSYPHYPQNTACSVDNTSPLFYIVHKMSGNCIDTSPCYKLTQPIDWNIGFV